jgi:hypothetical protein
VKDRLIDELMRMPLDLPKVEADPALLKFQDDIVSGRRQLKPGDTAALTILYGNRASGKTTYFELARRAREYHEQQRSKK